MDDEQDRRGASRVHRARHLLACAVSDCADARNLWCSQSAALVSTISTAVGVGCSSAECRGATDCSVL